MPVRPARIAGATALALAVLSLAACSADSGLPGASDEPESADETTPASAPESEAELATNLPKNTDAVPVDTLLEVTAKHAKLRTVAVTSAAGDLPGEVSGDRSSWKAGDRLEPGTTYTMTTVAEDEDGDRVRERGEFTTQALTLDQQTYPSVAPLEGETVGVGMPVIVSFDVPVSHKAEFEKNMTVTSTPRQPGSWNWVSDTEAHWRPKAYWKAGTDVSVDVDVNGVDAGNGIYGQEDREVDFEIGDAHIYRVNAQTYQMRVFSNGTLLRTIPVTTGKPGFTTRSGVKVIMEKFDSKRMNSETVGIPQGSSEAYDIDNVQWAMRVTNSGEFIHAAPWSVGSQGNANVSHGCTGLSPENAGWLYSMTMRGDVVEYTGTDRSMEPGNGYTDWNYSFGEYKKGSALS
jgi:lipoprotein-anchoring transpeptidase ErfK/SrfK